MKILQVNCVYNTGSTGKIVHDLHTELKKRGIDSIVCYGRGARTDEPNVYKTCGEFYSRCNNLITRLTGVMYGGCRISTNRLIALIEKEKPDIVHLHCINGYFVNIYKLISYLRDSGIKTVLTLHAEFMYTGNCGHALECEKWKTGCEGCPRFREETRSILFDRTHFSWMKMKNAFDGFNNLTVTSVSPWLMERAKQSPILEDKHHCVVLNGIDTDIFHPYDTAELKKKYGLTDEKVIFHVTADFRADPQHIKGGYYVLELAKRLIKENVKIFVAGRYDNSIIPPENLIFLGHIADQKLLAQYYSMADVTMLTSKKETFSMVCAESLCCGTPVVGFKAGGPEQISLPEYSGFVKYGNMAELLFEAEKKMKIHVCVKVCKKCYSKQRMVEDYHELYEKIYREKQQ